MDTILNRRSIRKYTSEPVADAQIEVLLRAAMAAPSACNEQPWHFVVIRERKTLDAIPQFQQYAQMLREAPLCIVVCAEPARQIATDGYWIQDCSAATQNILLAATDLGLGSCWLGMYPSEGRPEALRQLLGIPDHIIPMAAIALGHPAETQPPSERYDAERVRWEGW